MMKRNPWALVAVIAMVAACADAGREAPRAPNTAGSPPPTPRAPEPATPTAGWTVSPTGIGSVRVEMTLAQASRQLGAELTPRAGATPECAYVRPTTIRDSVIFMVIDGRIARVDVQAGRVATVEGARIGDTEERIKSLYAGRVEEQPHKYTDGHYLVVRPAERADSAYRIVFETDGQRVTKYRSGRLPEVSWVEGCS
jgi:hypothetical protein